MNHAAPEHFEPRTDFDYDEVDRGNPLAELEKDNLKIGADILHALISWWADSMTEQIAARKLWITCYVLRPDLFSEGTRSRFAINRGFSKQVLNRYAAQLRIIAPGFMAAGGWSNESRESLRRKRKRPVAAKQPTNARPAKDEQNILKGSEEVNARPFDKIQADIQRDELQRAIRKGRDE